MELVNNGMIQTDETDETCHHRHSEKDKTTPWGSQTSGGPVRL